jgi:hypothetical protein
VKALGLAVVGIVACLLGQGCSGSGGARGQSDAGGGQDAGATDDYLTPTPELVPDVVHTYAPTYSAVYGEILQPSCAWVFCHGAAGTFLDLSSKEVGYASLVNVPASGRACRDSGLQRVEPGHPEASLLYLKVTTPPCGDKMPLNGAAATLDSSEIAQIVAWVEAGAPNN